MGLWDELWELHPSSDFEQRPTCNTRHFLLDDTQFYGFGFCPLQYKHEQETKHVQTNILPTEPYMTLQLIASRTRGTHSSTWQQKARLWAHCTICSSNRACGEATTQGQSDCRLGYLSCPLDSYTRWEIKWSWIPLGGKQNHRNALQERRTHLNGRSLPWQRT